MALFDVKRRDGLHEDPAGYELGQQESRQGSNHLMSPEGLLDEMEKSWRSMVGVGVRTDRLPRTERAGGI